MCGRVHASHVLLHHRLTEATVGLFWLVSDKLGLVGVGLLREKKYCWLADKLELKSTLEVPRVSSRLYCALLTRSHVVTHMTLAA